MPHDPIGGYPGYGLFKVMHGERNAVGNVGRPIMRRSRRRKWRANEPASDILVTTKDHPGGSSY
jgi:hypothetical protein